MIATTIPTNNAGLELPPILIGPPKLYQMVTSFHAYRYFLLEGGRNGGKSQYTARFLLFLADTVPKLKIVCGREVQNKIEESVYTLLVEIINEFKLPFRVTDKYIKHLTNGSRFTFRGFQGMTAEDIKGLQGVDILWVDEAQSLQPYTVKTIIPTIRKNTSKLIFTMNRLTVDDAVYDDMSGRPNCLHIPITYLDNPFCPTNQIEEANYLKAKNLTEYKHIWLGHPRASAEDYLIDSDSLYAAFDREPMGDPVRRARVLSIDFALEGDDKCVATILDRLTLENWEIVAQIPWSKAKPMVSVGKIVALMGEYKPDVTIIDAGGAGAVAHSRLDELLPGQVQRFDGGSTEGIDQTLYANVRAAAYFRVQAWFDDGFLCLDREKYLLLVKQLGKIRFSYRSGGQRLMQDKKEMKSVTKGIGQSPDESDSLMMAIWAATVHLGRPATSTEKSTAPRVARVAKSRRHRR